MRVELTDLSKTFDDQMVLDRVNFDEDVATLAVIGPSGGGKSTLLRIIGGLEQPTSGTVSIDGHRVDYRASALPKYRASLGFVFQHSGLFDHLTAEENIALPLTVVHGVDQKTALERARGLLDRFGLAREASKRPAQLSGGERQRVAIARAVAPEPKLLLLDEPTSALDPEYTADVLDLVATLVESGSRLIIVTHEMGFARKACANVAFLSGGQIVEYGASEQVFSDPKSKTLRKFLSKINQWS